MLLCLVLSALGYAVLSQTAWAGPVAEDDRAAVILSYQRIGEDRHPSTSIRAEQFEAQIREVLSGRYNIVPLPRIIQAFRDGKMLPPRTIALTFDGAYKSAFQKAFPLLLDHDIPFTVFVAPATLGSSNQFATETRVLKLARNDTVTIGLHSDQYRHLLADDTPEIRRQMNNALAWYRKHFEREPEIFAYPFGEYNDRYLQIVKTAGFKAALGQQSGAAYSGSDLMALPRFVLTESYGDLNRFRLVANALPLPVKDISPSSPALTTDTPDIAFTLDADIDKKDALSCFISGQSAPAELVFLGERRIKIKLTSPLYNDRHRVNCTLPETFTADGEEERRWRWFGMLLTKMPNADSAPD